MSRNEPFKRAYKGLTVLVKKGLRLASVGFFLLMAGAVQGADLSVQHANQSPTRLARGPAGKIYTTDPKAGSVFIYDAGLNLTGELKNLNLPLGIAVGVDGTIYVGCQGTRSIRAYTATGDFIKNIGEGVLGKPSDIALDLYGNLYVADSPAHCIRIYNMNGGHLGDIGSFGVEDGEFNFPVAVDIAYTTNGVGELFVADQGNDRFQVFDLRGNLLRTLSLGKIGDSSFGAYKDYQVGTLQSLVIDDEYRIHSLDTQASRIQIWDAVTGAYIENYGAYGAGIGLLNLPLDILITDPVNGTNRVVVANSRNRRVEFINELATLGDIQLTASPVAENAAAGTTVGTLSLSPAVAGPIMYKLVEATWPYDNAFFEITGGTNLVTLQPLNYEQITNMQIRVKAIGPAAQNLTLAQTLALPVIDANDPPGDLQLSSWYVLEGQPANTLVGTFSATDEDAGDTQTYSLVAGFGDSGNTSFTMDGANLMTLAPFNHTTTNLYTIRVQVADAGGLTETGLFDIDIYPTNSVGDADLDGDGISDWWEADFDNDITDLDPALDTDGDGVINMDEWIAGTDPIDPNVFFEIDDSSVDDASGDFVIYWRSREDRSYGVYWRTNMTESLQLLTNGIIGTPPYNSYTDTLHSAESQGFYRLKVEHTP